MELTGSGYLYNLSLLGATFAVMSALVNLLRQGMGGRMSNFDVYLLRNFVAAGLLLSIVALLPPLVGLLSASKTLVWVIASVTAAASIAVLTIITTRTRRQVSGQPAPLPIKIALGLWWLAVALLVANASVPFFRNAGLYALALSLFYAMVAWSFVRRIWSLVGQTPAEDWNPQKG